MEEKKDDKSILVKCPPALLNAFKRRLLDDDSKMQAAIIGWIAEYAEGQRGVHGKPPVTHAKCPLCESDLKVTPKGFVMVKPGPLEPMAPGEIPEEFTKLVRDFLALYQRDENFAMVTNSLLTVYSANHPSPKE